MLQSRIRLTCLWMPGVAFGPYAKKEDRNSCYRILSSVLYERKATAFFAGPGEEMYVSYPHKFASE